MKCFPCCKKKNSQFANATTLSLCLSAATHSFILFSFFPYAGYMSVNLINNNNNNNNNGDDYDNDENNNNNATIITVDNVGIYAGLLGSVFTLGRFIGFIPWKLVRNSFGGKYTLMLSLFLTGIASIWVGMAQSYTSVVIARFIQGISNCISGCVKRAAINAQHNYDTKSKQYSKLISTISTSSESDEKEEEEEEIGSGGNAQALILSIMWWGTALGPIIGGLLSDPRFLTSLGLIKLDDDVDSSLSETTSSSSSSWFNSYPFLLSNLFSAGLCWLSMICVGLFTNSNTTPHQHQHQHQHNIVVDDKIPIGEMRPLLAPPIKTKKRVFISLWEEFWKLWMHNSDARLHLIAYFSFSFVVVCVDEALPLFLITSTECTGLGLSEGQVGGLLSASALIVAICHHNALEHLFDVGNGSNDGMYRTLNASTILGNVPAVLIPLSLLFNNNYDNSGSDSSSPKEESLLGMTPSSFLYLVVLVALLRGSASVYFSIIGVATGKTLRVVHNDEAAHIMTMGTLLIRSLAPVTAGAVLSHFMSSSSCSPWWFWIVIGLFWGSLAAIMTVRLGNRSRGGIVLSVQQRTYLANRLKRMSSYVTLWEKYEEKEAKTVGTRMENCMFRSSAPKKMDHGDSDGATSTTDINKEDDSKPASFTWKNHIIAPGVDFDKISFFIIGTNKNDKPCMPHVLHPPIMYALQKHLPQSCERSNFWLKYSSIRDGTSSYSLEVKSGLARYTVMAIETLKGDVFGCFMSKPWMTTNNQYRRCGESFLWRMKRRRSITATPELEVVDDNDIDIFPWTGENDLCQLFADDKIACGGGVVGTGDGFGIVLNSDLMSGSSSPCLTYGNPSLCTLDGEESLDGQFEVANIEVWALTSYMFVADAEKSEKSLKLLKDNSFAEGETPSTTSPWSNFL